MICSYCGTDLPVGAMFCGECGRPVAARAGLKARARTADAAATAGRWPVSVAEHDPAESSAPSRVRRVQAAGTPASHSLVEPPRAADAVFADPPETALAKEPDAADSGRSAADAARDAAAAERASVEAEVIARAKQQEAELARRAQLQADGGICAQCGAELAPSDIFCGVCGFVRKSVSAASARPSDTAVVERVPLESLAPVPPVSEVPVDVPADEPVEAEPASVEPEPAPAEPEPAPSEPASVEPEPAEPEQSAEPLPAESAADDSFAPDPEVPAQAARDPFPWGLPKAKEAIPAPVAPAAPDESFDDGSDVEQTRIVKPTVGGDRFVLQFSTGESVSVSGTGLIGRNPVPEPGEYFDSLVTIVDPGKSVSKTHLEYGQDAGAFWVSDRFSANGTVLREPERPARRGDAGKRYRIVRGTRVDIGEQFFIVS